MPIEPPPPPADPLVDAVAGEFSRVLRDAVGRLRDEHARSLESAVAAAQLEAERARELVVQEALADARAEFDQERRRLADQHATGLRDLEASLRAEADTALEARLRDAEARLREELGAETRAAVADAEERVRAEGEQALALATSEVEARLRGDADAALRLAQEAFERRLSDTPPPVPVSAMPLAARAAEETPPASASEREVRLASLERMLLSIERLDAAPSLRAALDALAEAVAAEAPRSAVWVVRGDRLKGWRASADHAPADFSDADLHLADAGPLARAVSGAAALPIKANELSGERDALAWLRLDKEQAGLAVPVTVDGRVVALVYADDGASVDRDVPGSWPEAVQVLARHAARVLEVLTARRASGIGRQPGTGPSAPAPSAMTADEARRVARLVVAEIKQSHEFDARPGREADDDPRTRLAHPIARARRMFDERVPASVAGRDEIFDDELNRMLATGEVRLLDARDSATA